MATNFVLIKTVSSYDGGGADVLGIFSDENMAKIACDELNSKFSGRGELGDETYFHYEEHEVNSFSLSDYIADQIDV